jgi:hypothetical protein
MPSLHELSAPWSDEVWLLGAPTLDAYVAFVKRRTEGGHRANEGELIRQWQAAAARYRKLQVDEKGLAETVEMLELPEAMRPLADRVLADPHFCKVFDSLPCALGLVELDKLVVYQPDITADHVERIREQLGPERSAEALFRICLPFDRALPEVRVGQTAGLYVFHSPSTDLRFLGAELLDPAQLRDFVADGPAVGVIALIVGFGSNYLNVVRFANRLVLNNGYHRAYALRALGITHAPCAIQAVTRSDEMGFAGSSEIEAHWQLYFESSRPPLLKDFFDPELARHFRTPRMRRQVQVKFSYTTLTVPE